MYINSPHHTFILLCIAFVVLVLSPLAIPHDASAQSGEDYEYVRSYSSGDGRSQIEIHTRSSSDTNTSIQSSVTTFSSTHDNAEDNTHHELVTLNGEKIVESTLNPQVADKIQELLDTIKVLTELLQEMEKH